VVIANSAAGREAHIAAGYRPRKWRVIGNGFDVDRFRPDPGARDLFRAVHGATDKFLIGLVARYDPMKDHTNFLRAAEMFLRKRPGSRFVLVGTGVDGGNQVLASEIRELGLDSKVILLGERSDLPAILPGLDVLTLSSSFGEGFSNAIGEGMACGLPCVVTDVGDMAEVVGPTGRVVPPGQPDALAAAWNELESLGEEGRNALGETARARVRERFGLDSIVRQYETTYRALAAGSGRLRD
jgi:glycosyltransferase involved in cell wall biosynthesis